jgi:hypothetical protein
MCLSLAFRENREVLKEKVKNKIYGYKDKAFKNREGFST